MTENNSNSGSGGGRNNNNNNSGSASNSSSNNNRNRGPRKRINKRNKQQGPKRPTVPPPPQTKLIFRNIGNAETFGSVRNVLKDLVQKVIEASNVKTQSQYTIDIDTVALRFLLEEEEVAKKYLEQQEKEKEEAKREQASGASEEDTNEDGAVTKDEEGDEAKKVETEETSKEEEKGDDGTKETPANELEIIVAPSKPSNVPVITARPLYVIPPKKTRRRGERGGVAYVLLTAPKIEKIETADATASAAASETATANKDAASSATEPVPVLISEGTGEVTPDSIPEGEVAPQKVVEVAVAPSPATTAPPPTPAAATASSVDYSKAIAQGRLLLSRAIDSLTDLADDDMKAQQNFAGCTIEPSMSGKTWRHQHHRSDRREGTIESTADYKNWLQGLSKQKEELKARPKPTPGGGALSLTGAAGGAATTDADNGQPISAIVQHLRAKRQELKRKKAKKKKEKNDKNKGKASSNANTSSNNNSGNKGKDSGRGGGEKGRRGEGGQTKKKKKKGGGKKGGGSKSNQVAPTALLKPQLR